MARRTGKTGKTGKAANGATLGFEVTLWQAADKMARLTAELKKQMEEGAKLDKLIWANLEGIGYGQ